MEGKKELLRKLGEETLYSAKGHFKACDLRRNLITGVIWSCIVFSLLDLANLFESDTWLDILGLFGTIAILIWNEGDGKDYKTKQKQIGEKYLVLHKEIRACYFLDECNEDQVKALSDKVTKLDESDRPDIPVFAKWLAKRAIEISGETDNWFSNQVN